MTVKLPSGVAIFGIELWVERLLKAFVALNDGYEPTEALRRGIMRFARQKLAAAIAPREIEFVASLPKTRHPKPAHGEPACPERSRRVEPRLLKARELGLPEGDASTLEEE